MQRKIKVNTIQKAIKKEKNNGETIGFVPTMGALHEGHMSLIRQAKDHSDVVVCSIFVNPTQFNDKGDLKKYPRTIKSDMAMLKKERCDYVFTPSVKEVYPNGKLKKIDIDLKGLDMLMEGEFRPGHFAGVVQVVKRLLDIVQPDHLYMGQKDFQQFTIIQHMIDVLSIPTELVVCPIMREEHGLAMSSRNRRLNADHRTRASIIYETLKYVKSMMNEKSPYQLQKWALEGMDIEGFRPEYFIIADGKTLLPITSFDDHDYVVACTAVWAGEVRLIDNMILKNNSILHTPAGQANIFDT